LSWNYANIRVNSGEKVRAKAHEVGVVLHEQAVATVQMTEEIMLVREEKIIIDTGQPVVVTKTTEIRQKVPETVTQTVITEEIRETEEFEEATDESSGCAPEFVLTLSDVSAKLGDSVKLKCIVTGSPTPVINWRLDEEIIKETE